MSLHAYTNPLNHQSFLIKLLHHLVIICQYGFYWHFTIGWTHFMVCINTLSVANKQLKVLTFTPHHLVIQYNIPFVLTKSLYTSPTIWFKGTTKWQMMLLTLICKFGNCLGRSPFTKPIANKIILQYTLEIQKIIIIYPFVRRQ